MSNLDRVDKLTETQRAYLRLAYMNLSSKEIALRVGVQPNSVDQRIKAALRTLGVSTRREAARMLAEREGWGPYRELAYRPAAVVGDANSSDPKASGDAGSLILREERRAFEVHPFPEGDDRFRLPLRIGDRPNGLSLGTRLFWLIAIPVAIAAAIGMLAIALEVIGTALLRP